MDDDDWQSLAWLSQQTAHVRSRNNYRHSFNPVSAMSDKQFRREFRMTKQSFSKLHMRIAPLISGTEADPGAGDDAVAGKQTPKFMKLLITLKYFACGEFHADTGNILGYSSSHVCVVLKEVSPAIASLSSEYIKTPTYDDRRRVSCRCLYSLAK